MRRALCLVVLIAGCGRFRFDERTPTDACESGGACTPAAVCWTGAEACGTGCLVDQPLDQIACPGGTCATGVCTGPASAPFSVAATGVNAYFGTSVDSDGQRLIVGAVVTNAAYIFERSGATWTKVATLTSAYGPMGSDFGAAVAIEGDLAVVGSRYSKGPGNAPASGTGGAIVIYQRDAQGSWNEQAGILGPDGGEFGNAIDVHSGRILVGAEYANTIGYGTAYVLEGAGASWSIVATFHDPIGDRLGHAVQLGDDVAFTGSLWDPGPHSTETGAVRVWTRDPGGTWSFAQLLQPDDPRADAFGQGMSLDGNRLAVGVPWFSDPDRDTGEIYLYERDATGTWNQTAMIDPPLKQKDGTFGRGILLRGDRLFATTADWTTTPASVTTSVYRVQPDGRWLEVGRRIDPGGGDNGFAYGGIECDLQMAGAGDTVVVGFPIRGYTAGAAPGAIVFQDATSL